MKFILLNEYKKPICNTNVFIQYTALDDIIMARSNINILLYSSKLLSLDRKTQRRFIEDINFLCELDNWTGEYYLPKIREKLKNDNPSLLFDNEYEIKELSKEIYNKYKEIAIKYGLEVKSEID